MKTFKNTTYKDTFIVTTTGSRKVGAACSIEHARILAEKGRNRIIWKRRLDGEGYGYYC